MPRKGKKKKQKADDTKWLFEDETWLDVLRDAFIQFDGQPERAMRLFHRLVKELENGSEAHVRTCLGNAARVAFCFSQFHQECWRFYRDTLLGLPEAKANALLERITEIMRKETLTN